MKGEYLTEQQLKYYEAIEWLLDKDSKATLGSGRSHVMMLAFINIARKNKGKSISVFDHTNDSKMNQFMLQRILKHCTTAKIPISINLTYNSIKWIGKK